MKRWITLVLIVVLIIGFCACSSMPAPAEDADTQQAEEQSAETPTKAPTQAPAPAQTAAPTPEPKDGFGAYPTDITLNGWGNSGLSAADGATVYGSFQIIGMPSGITAIDMQTGEISMINVTSDMTQDTMVEEIICVYDGYIYFRASRYDVAEETSSMGLIMCIGIDGMGEEIVYTPKRMDGNASCTAYDSYILYSYRIDEQMKVFRIDMATGETKQLQSLSSYSVASDGEYIYFDGFVGGNAPGLCRTSMDGGGIEAVAPDTQPAQIVPAGDWLYYTSYTSNPLTICRVKKDGSDQQELGETKMFSQFNVAGDYIYYADPNDGLQLYRMKTDGTGKEKICDIGNIKTIDISAGRVFFMYTEREDGGSMYSASVLPDGSGFIAFDETLLQ